MTSRPDHHKETDMTSTGPILIAYDGSEHARHAIEHASSIFPGAAAVVLYVREPLEGLAEHLDGEEIPAILRAQAAIHA